MLGPYVGFLGLSGTEGLEVVLGGGGILVGPDLLPGAENMGALQTWWQRERKGQAHGHLGKGRERLKQSARKEQKRWTQKWEQIEAVRRGMWGNGKKQEGQEDTGKEQRERSRGRHGLLAIKLLDAPAVIIGQHKVLCVHPLVKGRHDGRGVTGMLEAQGVAQLMHGHQKDVIPWREERDYGGGRDPFPQAPNFPI